MRGTVLYGPRDVRFEERPDPTIVEPTDAIIRLPAHLRVRLGPLALPRHRAGRRSRRRWATSTSASSRRSAARSSLSSRASSSSARSSPPTTPARSAGPATSRRCIHRQPGAPTGAQAQYARIPLADGTLVATPDMPPDDLIPSLLAASDVLGTGWFGAVAAEAGPGKTVAVVGDGAVGLLAVLAAKQLGAERIIAMSRHESRQRLAREFGATEIVTERGEEGAARIKELTDGLGAHSVVEAVGTQESMMQAIRSTRPGGHVGFVGVLHDVEMPGRGVLLLARAPARRSRPGAALPARADRPDLEPEDRPRQGLRPDAAAGGGGGGLPRDGRAPRDQDAAAPVNARGTDAPRTRTTQAIAHRSTGAVCSDRRSDPLMTHPEAT